MTQTRAHDQTSGLEHLPHAWTAFGTEVSEHDDCLFAPSDGPCLDGHNELFFGVKRPRLAGKAQAFFSRNLGDCTTGCQVASQNPSIQSFDHQTRRVARSEMISPNVSSRFQGVLKGANDVLVCRQFPIRVNPAIKVFSQSLPRDGHGVPVNVFVL